MRAYRLPTFKATSRETRCKLHTKNLKQVISVSPRTTARRHVEKRPSYSFAKAHYLAKRTNHSSHIELSTHLILLTSCLRRRRSYDVFKRSKKVCLRARRSLSVRYFNAARIIVGLIKLSKFFGNVRVRFISFRSTNFHMVFWWLQTRNATGVTTL